MAMLRALLVLLLLQPTIGRNPSYLLSHLGRTSKAASRVRPQLLNTNSLLRHATRPTIQSHHHCSRMLTRRYILDFFDPLEPFELAWEFYCKRYEILDELVVKLVHVTKRNSVKALAALGGALVLGEVLARVGVLGGRGKGMADYFKNSERFNEGTQERVYQKGASWMIDAGMGTLRTVRKLGGKSKFAISVSAGAFFGQTAISATVFCVRAVLVSFFFIETLSFLGVIGDMGESILDWVDDERDRQASWTMKLAKCHKQARHRMSFEWLEELYEAAVDEEKIASFGFSVGTVFALLT